MSWQVIPVGRYRLEAFERARNKPAVTITRGGHMLFNKAAYELAGRPSAVIYSFDREGRRIGVRPSDRSVPYAYAVTSVNGGAGHRAYCAGFLAHFGVECGPSRRFRVKLEDGQLVFRLADYVDVARRRSRPPAPQS